jgi:hypothetical protein
MKAASVGCVVFVLVAGCSSSPALTVAQARNQEYCARRAECGLDERECAKELLGFTLPEACVAAARAASCVEVNDKASNVQKTCFPPCDLNTPPSCEEETMTTCTTDGGTVVIECAWYCRRAGLTYQGGCRELAVSAFTPRGGTVCTCG